MITKTSGTDGGISPIAPTIQVDIAPPPESGIRLDYPGKRSVRAILGKLQPRVQRRLSQWSCGTEEEQADNLIVEGDNLQVMASLYRVRGQVDLIVADPPYNTGKDFRYNDRWDTDPNDPDPGEIVAADDTGKHSKWMRFMAPRLEMMKSMLKPGGVCAICIDDRELFRLGMMLDETFGERNRLGIINWQKSYSPKSGSDHVSKATEYVLVYAKSREKASTALLGRTEKMNARYRNPDNDPKGNWKGGDLSAPMHKDREDYGIQSPFTGDIHYPPGSRRWGIGKASVRKALEAWGSPYVEIADPASQGRKSLVLKGTKLIKGVDREATLTKDVLPETDQLVTPLNIIQLARERAIAVRDAGVWPEIVFLKDGEGAPALKGYLSEVKKGRVTMTYWAHEDYDEPFELGAQSWNHAESGHSQAGIRELADIVGSKHAFETVKPLRLISKIIQIWCPPDGLVLDPFAGSGTTGHAVLYLNRESDASRRFIMIEQSRPEKGDAYARTLTADRMKRVVTGNWETGSRPPLPGGFTFKTSTTQVDGKAVLAMQREELVDLVLMTHWEIKSRNSPMLTTLVHKDYRYLVAKDSTRHGYFLVWEGPDIRSPLDDDVLEEIIREAELERLVPPYHVHARIAHVIDEDVQFYKIPRDILAQIGYHDAFGSDEER